MRIILPVLTIFILTACASNPHPEGKPVAQITFEHLEPIEIAVDKYEIENRYKETPLPIPIEKTFYSPPDVKFAQYLKARFVADGSSDARLNVSIEDAHVTYSYIPAAQEYKRMLGMGGTDQYKITYKIIFSGLNYPHYDRKDVILEGERTLQMSEHISLAGREKAQMEAVEAMIRDIDADVVKVVKEELGL